VEAALLLLGEKGHCDVNVEEYKLWKCTVREKGKRVRSRGGARGGSGFPFVVQEWGGYFISVGMATRQGGDGFRYPIPIPAEKIHPHPHTQTERVLNFCPIPIPTG